MSNTICKKSAFILLFTFVLWYSLANALTHTCIASKIFLIGTTLYLKKCLKAFNHLKILLQYHPFG